MIGITLDLLIRTGHSTHVPSRIQQTPSDPDIYTTVLF